MGSSADSRTGDGAGHARGRAVDRELVRDVFRRSKRSLPALLIIVAVICWVVWRVLEADAVARLALAATTLLIVARIGLVSAPDAWWPRARRVWWQHTAFIVGAAATSIGLGALDYRAYAAVDLGHACVLVLLNAGVVSGAMMSMSSSPLAYYFFMGPAFGTLIALLFRDPRPWPSTALALTWLVWIAYLVVQARDHHATRRQSLLLNLELDDKVKQIDEKVRQVEEAHAKVARYNEDLAATNARLVQSNVRANRIFSALAQALPGRVLDDKYRLEELIGEGGFAVVFRATAIALDRQVAVKVFRPQPGNDSAFALERFVHEGRALSKLEHPNIVRIYDYGISRDGIAFIAMELLEGTPLSEEMRERGAASLVRAARIVADVGAALAAAHGAGIVHRDVKPQNVVLRRTADREEVKLVDFGIARTQDLTHSVGDHLTRPGAVLGTPAYMAPERWQGIAGEASADVWALGVLAYQLISGRLPYVGAASEIAIDAVREAPPSLGEIDPRIPATVSELVMCALQMNRENRPSAKDFGERLVAVVDALPGDVQRSAFGYPPRDRSSATALGARAGS